jgi:hypothetical protein
MAVVFIYLRRTPCPISPATAHTADRHAQWTATRCWRRKCRCGPAPPTRAEQRDSLNARDRQEGIATEHSTAHAWGADSSGNFSPLKPVRRRVHPSFHALTLIFRQLSLAYGSPRPGSTYNRV